MKAIVIEKFGGAQQLKVAEVPAPVPGPDEVLIEVDHAAVNPVDWKIREGYLVSHVPHDLPIILGWDAAGVVRAKGAEVKAFVEGDRVFAYCRKPVVKMGTYAEYVTMPASAVAHAPAGLDSAAAATVPLAALTAWQALFEAADLREGETVLIPAASGGVGGYAVQLARHAGARVFGTCGPGNLGYVKELGATALDYTGGKYRTEFLKLVPGGADVIFDCVGGETLKESYGLLKAGGRLVSIVDQPSQSEAQARGVSARYHFVYPNGVQLEKISELLAEGKIRPLPYDVLPISRVAEAHGRSEGRRRRGKIALKVKGGF